MVALKGSQVGWTDILGNVVGYHVDQDPAPILLIQPTLEMGQAWSKDRLAPMIRDTEALREKVSDPSARDSENTILHKLFPGGHLAIVGANSPAGLASRPIRVVLADEVDRYPASAGTEGDPLKLAAKRQITFWNRKTLIGSTPTRLSTSVIWREWLRSDQRRYLVPCPDCGHPQHLKWSCVVWDKEEEDGQKFHLPDTARYVCEECGSLWDDVSRWNAIRDAEKKGGGWLATAESNGVAGFHIPGFLSSWLTLSEIVSDFLEAKDHPDLLQVWTNTVLGEPFEEKGETVDSTGLISRGEAYGRDNIPDAIRVITAGVDTQADRLEVQVLGFGFREETWALEYNVIYGDPAQTHVWDELDTFLKQPYVTESGRRLMIRSVACDTGGHHAANVHAFCRMKVARKVWAVKGAAGPRPIWPKRGSKTPTKDTVFIVGVDTAKDAVYGRLRIEEPGPGYIHFPVGDEFSDVYFTQLTIEQVLTKYKFGKPYRVWVCPQGKRNEALDTFVYALAARHSLPGRLDVPLSAQAAQSQVKEEGEQPAVELGIAPPQARAERPRGRQIRRSTWMS